MATWKKQKEQFKVMSFLAALNSEFTSALFQILIGSEVQSLDVSFACTSRLLKGTVSSNMNPLHDQCAHVSHVCIPSISHNNGKLSGGNGHCIGHGNLGPYGLLIMELPIMYLVIGSTFLTFEKFAYHVHRSSSHNKCSHHS